MTKKSNDDYDELYKLVIIGDSSTGKSSLVNCFTGEWFSTDYRATVGIEFQIRTVVLDGVIIKFQVWFSDGNFKPYGGITTAFYREAAGAIVAYSVTKKETFLNVPHWIEEAKKFGRPDLKLIVVGTGCDRKDREVDYFTARDFADEQQLSLLEVSAKVGTNVELAFLTLIQEIRQLRQS